MALLAPSPPLTRNQVLGIAPTTLRAPEGERYRGDTVTCSLDLLPLADRATVTRLYEFLLDVYKQTRNHADDDDGGVATLASLAGSAVFDDLVERVARIGASLHADDVSMEVKQSLHDIRGGSLMALIMHLDMALEGDALPEDTQRVFLLARDHLKMMRNAIHDLDVDRYNADLASGPTRSSCCARSGATWSTRPGRRRRRSASTATSTGRSASAAWSSRPSTG